MRFLLPLLFALCCHAQEGTKLTNLPVLRLQVPTPIGAETKVDCTAQLFVPAGSGTSDATPAKGGIKIRGASSQQYDKKSFSLKLEKETAWLGLTKNREWILNAAFVDFSMMRHKISYDLYRSLTVPGQKHYAAGSRFIEVELNGKYHGIYLLMEVIQGSLVDFPEALKAGEQPGVLYKAVGHAANFAQAGHADYEQKEPDDAQGPFWGPLDELNQFISAASEADFFNPRTGIASRLNIDNAMDFHLLVLLTSNLDGISKNYLIGRAPFTPGPTPTKFFFVPWDYDGTFGRNWDGSQVDEKTWLSNRLFDRLLANAEYRRKFAQRWRELRARVWNTSNILKLIDDNTRTLGLAVRRNELRWRNLDGKDPKAFNFNTDVAQIKNWVTKRAAWLDTELAQRSAK